MSNITTQAPPIAADLAQSYMQAWRKGTPPDAALAIQEHPTLLRYRSLVVDLAYEEYCLREEAGQTPNTEAFCRELPAFRSEIREVIRGHRVLADHPELFERAEVRWPTGGELFEGFKVVREIGRGAFARVFVAVDPDTGNRPVVLKLSPAPSAEASTLGPVRHPHVAEVLWARRANGLSAICMRFVGAATLRDVVAAAFSPSASAKATARTVLTAIATAGADLPAADKTASVIYARQRYVDAIATIAAQLADALAHLHDIGVTHGDLKPSNIVLGPTGHPYLIDFNLAAAGDSLQRIGGTLPYMAPECIRGILGQPDGVAPTDRSDVYSFGAVLFDALNGRVPFEPIEGADMKVVAADLLSRQLADASQLNSSGVLTRLLSQCMAVDPAVRPTAKELHRQLNRFVRRRARRARVFVTAALTAVVGTGLGLFVGASSPPPIAPSTPVVLVAESEPTTADALIERGLRRLAENNIAQAEQDFIAAHKIRRNDQSAALWGFCRSKLGDHLAAVSFYEEAIGSGNPQPAWVYSDLAFSLTQTAKSDKSISNRAVAAATKAIELDDTLWAAHYNRAWAAFFANLDKKRKTLDPNCIAVLDHDLQGVMSAEVRLPEQFLLASLIYAASSSNQPARLDMAMSFLQEGVKHGLSSAIVRADIVLGTHLGRRPEFADICKRPATATAQPSNDPRLIEPTAR